MDGSARCTNSCIRLPARQAGSRPTRPRDPIAWARHRRCANTDGLRRAGHWRDLRRRDRLSADMECRAAAAHEKVNPRWHPRDVPRPVSLPSVSSRRLGTGASAVPTVSARPWEAAGRARYHPAAPRWGPAIDVLRQRPRCSPSASEREHLSRRGTGFPVRMAQPGGAERLVALGHMTDAKVDRFIRAAVAARPCEVQAICKGQVTTATPASWTSEGAGPVKAVQARCPRVAA
jgi:hypothetical protein